MNFSKAVFNVSVINIVGTFLALLNTVIVARLFGTNREVEIFFASNIIIRILLKLSQSGEMSEIILPLYHQYGREKGKVFSQKFVSSIINWYLLALIPFVLIVMNFAPMITSYVIPGFGKEDQFLAAEMIRLLSPLTLFIFYNGQIQTILNAEKKFGAPEFISLISRISLILALLLGHKVYGIWIMVYALWFSTIITSFLSTYYYYRYVGKYFFILRVEDESLYSSFGKIWSSLPYIGATQIYAIALNAGISFLPQGTFAVFNYARTIVTKLEAVFLRPIATIFFSMFSSGKNEDYSFQKTLISKALENVQLILFPFFLIFILLGETILSFFLLNEKFNNEQILVLINFIIMLTLFLKLQALTTIARKIVFTLGFVKESFFLMCIVQIFCASFAQTLIRDKEIIGVLITIFTNSFLLMIVPYFLLLMKKKEIFIFL